MPLPELLLIERIRALAGRASAGRGAAEALGALRKGIGDDCAVLAGSKTHDLLVTTDLSVEGVHFRLDWHPAGSVGHRCLARGLSDIAAMGGEPTVAFLSLGLPAHLPQKWVDEFLRGFHRLARRFAVTLAGGDIATSPNGIAADIVVLGRVPKNKAVLRSGARPGDLVYVTGTLGRSARALVQLQNPQEKGSKSKLTSSLTSALFSPEPRLKVGQWLLRNARITAMIDISDGLSTDMAHIAAESGVAAILLREAIPYDRSPQHTPAVRMKATRTEGAAMGRIETARIEENTRNLDFALHGGEDYELLFTASKKQKIPATIAGVRITRIGEIAPLKSRTSPLVIADEDGRVEPLKKRGWEHFSAPGMEYR